MTVKISLSTLRKNKNLTQEEVARLVGIDRSYYSKIEAGITPSVKVAKRLGDVLGFSWTVFFEENCAKNAQNKEVI